MRRPVLAVAAAVGAVVVFTFAVVVFSRGGDEAPAVSTLPSGGVIAGTAAELVCAGQACVEPGGDVGTITTSGLVDLSEAGVTSTAESVSVAPLAGQDAAAVVEVEDGKIVDMRALPPGPYLLTAVAADGVYQFNVELTPDEAG